MIRKPCFPPVINVKIILAETGPKSITGNIRIPSNLVINMPLNNLEATTRKAPVQEIRNVTIK
jgi:hypothetical protein